MSKNKLLSRVDSDLMPLQADLPTVPDAFRRTDYEGWLEEGIKRFQLKRYQRTQAERLAVLRQINQIQSECVALARNEADWRHFRQEDRLRQKRLDLQEMEIDHRMEDLLFEREKKLRERNAPIEPSAPPKRRDPVEEITAQLEEAIRTQAGVKELFTKARKANPHLEEWFNEWEAKVSWDLKERKWF